MGDENDDIGGDLGNYDCNTSESSGVSELSPIGSYATSGFSDSEDDNVNLLAEYGVTGDVFDELVRNARKSFPPDAEFPPPEAYAKCSDPGESYLLWLLMMNDQDQAAFNEPDPNEPGPSRRAPQNRRPGSPPNPALRNYIPNMTRKEYVLTKKEQWRKFKPCRTPPPDPSIGGGFLEGERDSPPLGNLGNMESRELADSPIGSPEWRAGLMGEPISRKRKRIHENPYEDCSDESDIEWEIKTNRQAERYRMKNRTPPVLDCRKRALEEDGQKIKRRELRPGQNSPSPTQPESGWSRTRPDSPTPARDACLGTPQPKRLRRRAERHYENDWGHGNSFVINPRPPNVPPTTPLRPVFQGQVFSSPEDIPEEEMETVELPDYTSNWNSVASTPVSRVRQAKDPSKRVARSISKSPDPLSYPQGKMGKPPTKRKLKRSFKKARFMEDVKVEMRRAKRAKRWDRLVQRGKKPPPLRHTPPRKVKVKKCRDPDCQPPHCPHRIKGSPRKPGQKYSSDEDED